MSEAERELGRLAGAVEALQDQVAEMRADQRSMAQQLADQKHTLSMILGAWKLALSVAAGLGTVMGFLASHVPEWLGKK